MRIATLRKRTVSLRQLREEYHRTICEKILSVDADTHAYSNADPQRQRSVALAAGIASRMASEHCSQPISSEQSHVLLTDRTVDFLQSAFKQLGFSSPEGCFLSAVSTSRKIARFREYKHLVSFVRRTKKEPELKAKLGGDCLLLPDIAVTGNRGANQSPHLPKSSRIYLIHSHFLVQASISCKWTAKRNLSLNFLMEPLNFIKSKKVRKHYIAVVLFEPLPSRIAFLALSRCGHRLHLSLVPCTSCWRRRKKVDTKTNMNTLRELW